VAACPRKHCAVAPIVPMQHARSIGSVWGRSAGRTAGWRSGYLARCACSGLWLFDATAIMCRGNPSAWLTCSRNVSAPCLGLACIGWMYPVGSCTLSWSCIHQDLTVCSTPVTARAQPPVNPAWVQRGNPRSPEEKRGGRDKVVHILARPRRRRLRQRARTTCRRTRARRVRLHPRCSFVCAGVSPS